MSQKTIIVVGGGLAGLSATIESATTNPSAHVILVDKEKNIGGNSAKATSGINGMTEKGDTFDDFKHDTLVSGGGLSIETMVSKLVDESVDALAWLPTQDPTLDLSLVSQCGGHSHPRTHRCPPKPDGGPVPVGWRLIQALKQKISTLDNVSIRTESRVIHLITNGDNTIRGVELASGEKIDAEAVVLTSGGFGGQTLELEQPDGTATLLSQYAPHLLNISTTNGPWANGDGVRLGLAVGAAAKDMDRIQIHPTGFVDPANPKAHTKFLAPEALRAYGGVLLSSSGRRFVNELGRRDALTKTILETLETPVAYLVMTDTMIDDFGRSTVEFYAKKGFFKKCEGVQGVAAHLGVSESTIEDEFKRYDLHVTERKDDVTVSAVPDSFGKTLFPHRLLDGAQTTYWVAQITPCIHYTMGGLEINTDAQVISEKTHQPVPGLYAAGEVTGGVHGKNRLAGNSLLECVVYGRTAGRNAAEYVKS